MPAYALEIIVVVLGLALLLLEAFSGPGKKRLIGYAAAIGLSVVFVLLFFVARKAPGLDEGIWKFYTDDGWALFYKGIALLTTISVLILGLDYAPVLEKFSARSGGGPAIGEFFALPVFICAGLMWMASAIDLTSVFVSLELVTISFYVMVTYMRRNVGSLEAGVKYLILGALSTGFFVYGITWLFGMTGETNLAAIAHKLHHMEENRGAVLFAFAMLLVGLGFKVAAVPFQLWVPDVYQGAPTPVAAYLSVGSKAAGFIVGARLLEPFLRSDSFHDASTLLLFTLAVATLIVGNLAAIPQTNFKRLLAYSSISHAGFLLLALACSPSGAAMPPLKVVSFYLGAYMPMTLLCFAVLGVINRTTGRDDLAAFDGLGKRDPLLAFALTIGVAALAGIPLTAGFMGKFFVFSLAIQNQAIGPVIVALIGAVAGFYYYLKILKNMYLNEPTGDLAECKRCPLTRSLIVALVAATLLLGVYPQALLQFLP